MKKVETPRLKDLSYFLNLKRKYPLGHILYFQKINFTPWHAMIILAMPLVLLGVFERSFLGIGLGIIAYALYKSTVLFKIKHGTFVERKIPQRAMEGDEIDIEYRIQFGNNIGINSILLEDSFNGHSNYPLKQIFHFNKSFRRTILHNKIQLDCGMGIKEFSQIALKLSDPFGIFPVKIVFNQEEKDKQEIKVYPRPLLFYGSIQSPRIHSDIPGNFDINWRGESIKFKGIKEFQQGDQIKRINWKKTMSKNANSNCKKKIFVNEFEKSVNANIILHLNLAYEMQLGRGAESTEELIKDVALGIAYTHIGSGNSMSLHCQGVPFHCGGDVRFINAMELILANLTHNQSKQSLKDISGNLNLLNPLPGSTLYYISPFIATKQLSSDIKRLLYLQSIGIFVVPIFIRSLEWAINELPSQYNIAASTLWEMTQKYEKTIFPILKKRGIRPFVLDIKRANNTTVDFNLELFRFRHAQR